MAPRECNQVVATRGNARNAFIMSTWSRRARRLGERIGIGPDAADFLREQLDRLDQASVSAQLEQSFPRLRP